MVDVHTKTQRSFNMSRIRCKNTKPEMIVRSLVHRMGYRYSLLRKDLPGKPDIVLVKHKKVIGKDYKLKHRDVIEIKLGN